MTVWQPAWHAQADDTSPTPLPGKDICYAFNSPCLDDMLRGSVGRLYPHNDCSIVAAKFGAKSLALILEGPRCPQVHIMAAACGHTAMISCEPSCDHNPDSQV